MGKGSRNAWVLVPLALSVPAFGILAGRALQRNLEQRAHDLDLGGVLREAGLSGQVVSAGWRQSRLNWFPEISLELTDVEARLLSGQPGPGRWSGRLTLRSVRLVPRLAGLSSGTLDLERIEATGGLLEIGPDLLPEPPQQYDDPIEGTRRPIPWMALLSVAADTADGQPDPWEDPAARRARDPRSSAGAPVVTVRDLEIRLAALESFPKTELQLERAGFAMSRDQMEVRGLLRAQAEGRKPQAIPVRLTRLGGGSYASWDAKVGRPGLGWHLLIHPSSRGQSSSGQSSSGQSSSGQSSSGQFSLDQSDWTLQLDDPAGKLVSALLEGRSGVMQHLRWSGPCRLEAAGSGRFPRGLKETRIELLSGRLSTDALESGPSIVARGRLEVRPGRVDLPSLTLRSGESPADSAVFRFQWVRSLRGRSLSGRLQGRLDPAWIALAGPDWRAEGSLSCNVSFEGSYPEDARGWSLLPRGGVEGTLQDLVSPWFADTLHDGRLSAWGEGRRIRAVLAGKWGESPFRLEVSGLPSPAPGYLDLVANDGSWDLSSPWCRLENFRLSAARFPHLGALPFWLGLPGRGLVRIDRGMQAGVPFDSLYAETFRSRESVRLDSLEVRIAGGRLWSGPSLGPTGGRWSDRTSGLSVKLRGEALDLSGVQRLLKANGALLPGDIRGRLTGTVKAQWIGSVPEGMSGSVIEGSLTAVDGSIRGLPLQEALRRSTRLDELGVLCYRELKAEIRKDPDGISWNRLRVDAPPLKIEGAGRTQPGDALHAVFMVRVVAGGDQPLSDLLLNLLGEGRSSVYTVLGGTLQTPSLQVVSRSAFLQELDRLGGALPLSGAMLN